MIVICRNYYNGLTLSHLCLVIMATDDCLDIHIIIICSTNHFTLMAGGWCQGDRRRALGFVGLCLWLSCGCVCVQFCWCTLNKVLYTFIVSVLRLYVTWEVGPLHLVSEAGYSWLFKPVSILVPKNYKWTSKQTQPDTAHRVNTSTMDERQGRYRRHGRDGAATGSKAARRLEGPRILHDAMTRLLSCNLMLLQSVRGLHDDAGHQVYER